MSVFDEIQTELARATVSYPPMHSPHEGYAVLKEEAEELWEEIKKKEPDQALLREEAIQVAAMAARFLVDCCGESVKPSEADKYIESLEDANRMLCDRIAKDHSLRSKISKLEDANRMLSDQAAQTNPCEIGSDWCRYSYDMNPGHTIKAQKEEVKSLRDKLKRKDAAIDKVVDMLANHGEICVQRFAQQDACDDFESCAEHWREYLGL